MLKNSLWILAYRWRCKQKILKHATLAPSRKLVQISPLLMNLYCSRSLTTCSQFVNNYPTLFCILELGNCARCNVSNPCNARCAKMSPVPSSHISKAKPGKTPQSLHRVWPKVLFSISFTCKFQLMKWVSQVSYFCT